MTHRTIIIPADGIQAGDILRVEGESRPDPGCGPTKNAGASCFQAEAAGPTIHHNSKSAGASQATHEFTHEEVASATAAANAFIGWGYQSAKPVDLSRYGANLQFHPLNQANAEALFAFAMDLARTPPTAPPITATEIGLRETIRTLVGERDASERTVLHQKAHIEAMEKVLAEFKTQVQQVTNERNVWKDIAHDRGQRMLEAARALQRTAQDGDKG